MNQNPEQIARDKIDQKLVDAEKLKVRMSYTQVEEIFRINGIYFKGNELTHALKKLAPPGVDIYGKSDTKYLKVDIRPEKIGLDGFYAVPNSIEEVYLGGQAVLV